MRTCSWEALRCPVAPPLTSTPPALEDGVPWRALLLSLPALLSGVLAQVAGLQVGAQGQGESRTPDPMKGGRRALHGLCASHLSIPSSHPHPHPNLLHQDSGPSGPVSRTLYLVAVALDFNLSRHSHLQPLVVGGSGERAPRDVRRGSKSHGQLRAEQMGDPPSLCCYMCELKRVRNDIFPGMAQSTSPQEALD